MSLLAEGSFRNDSEIVVSKIGNERTNVKSENNEVAYADRLRKVNALSNNATNVIITQVLCLIT